jgi:hypothetical protein
MQSVEVYKRTHDNWCPSFKLTNGAEELVMICFIKLAPDPDEPTLQTWRVCAWGDDDFGLERDFLSESAAWTCFQEIIGMPTVSIESLRELGLTSA